MKNVLAIIQARMGSTRFPGKVLVPLRGKPLVEWCVDACGAARVRAVVLVEGRGDAPLLDYLNEIRQEWALQNGQTLLRAFAELAEDNVSDSPPDTIVRICADSPMVTPQRIRQAALAVQAGASYCGFLDGNKPHPLSKRGDACEAFSIGCLRYEAEVAAEPECHQHVTWGMYQAAPSCQDARPYRRHWITLPSEPRYPAIDTPEDLETLKTMLSKEAEVVGS